MTPTPSTATSTAARPWRPRCLVPGIVPAAGIGGLALTSGVALTATSGWLITAASFRPQILTLLAVIVAVRAFGIARPVLRYVERVKSHDAALAALAEDRGRVYDRLIPLTPARLGARGRGDLLAGVVDDLDDVAYAQVRVVVPLVALAITGLAAVLIDALFLVPAVPVVVSTIVATLLVGAVDWWIEHRTQDEVVAARARVGDVAATVTRDGAELAAIGAHAEAAAWLGDAQRRLARAVRAQSWGRALGVGLMPLVAAGHAVWMAFLVEPWVQAGFRTPLAALLVLTPIALGEVIGAIPDAVGSLARAQGAAARLRRLLDQEPAAARSEESPSEDAPTPGPRPHVEARALEASWDGRRPALTGADLDVAPGEVVAVVGPNGSGKSTLLATLARHLDPTGGTYRLGDLDALAQTPADVRTHLAIVDDEVHVFASTLRENLRLARPDADDEEIHEALRLAGLGPLVASFPDGLDERLGTGGRGVSGGERARLGIARALLSRRPVLLLDEPVAHLDHPTAVAVLDDLTRASTDRAVVLVTHRPEGLDDATRVVTLSPAGGPDAGPGTGPGAGLDAQPG
ncbi:thiol reductant ABC exporter subunit CydC [Mobilicoccus pelagius]|uniref:Cysteine ABC transporter permease/ATP-binding protein CydC n=1 Tax=Mobilicoccus pelagius NBRC 104925 TaxID=1089455 RepID=H5UVU6_9MICO|nr:thiol reductant ABC exporter subunit CydC [Mobilicoccus pelagius]GAB49854.1 cysteine ABC transporter permease/ATP-binding protein CydC [Mobilicoccus pelagius NBRC 104925]